jgi:hypothetical protein
VPWIGPGERDVDVVLERQKGAVDTQELKLGGGFSGRRFGSLFIWIELTLAGMGTRVLAGQSRDDAILEHERRIAVHEIAAVEALADE